MKWRLIHVPTQSPPRFDDISNGDEGMSQTGGEPGGNVYESPLDKSGYVKNRGGDWGGTGGERGNLRYQVDFEFTYSMVPAAPK